MSPAAHTAPPLPCPSGQMDPGQKTKPKQVSQPGLCLLSLSLYFQPVYRLDSPTASSKGGPRPGPRSHAAPTPHATPPVCLHSGSASPPTPGSSLHGRPGGLPNYESDRTTLLLQILSCFPNTWGPKPVASKDLLTLLLSAPAPCSPLRCPVLHVGRLTFAA